MSKDFKRPIGLSFEDKLILDPYPNTSSIIYGASGSAKTSSTVMTAIQGLIGKRDLCLIINDVKDGEIASQIASLCETYNRKFAVLDEFEVLGSDYPYRVSLNPFGSITATSEIRPQDLLYSIETAAQALIPEDQLDIKNKYFREVPREEMDLGIRILLEHKPDIVTPGSLYALMADSSTWKGAVEIAAEEGDPALQSRARQSIDMRINDPEHYYQHLRAALTALRMYESGSTLHSAGYDARLNHLDLLNGSYVFCLVQPQKHMARLGSHYALHLNAFMDAQLMQGSGETFYILDELCNAPLKSAVERVTIQRSYGARTLYIAQSRLDIERKYGVKETAILEENCPVKEWLSFTNFEEAERVSRAMGEEKVITPSMGLSSGQLDFQQTLSMGKQRVFTAFELMNLDPSHKIIHVKNIGFIHCRKLYQNEIAPMCFELGENPLEGGRLPPNPKVTISISELEETS